jgi:hypothetical protein
LREDEEKEVSKLISGHPKFLSSSGRRNSLVPPNPIITIVTTIRRVTRRKEGYAIDIKNKRRNQ